MVALAAFSARAAYDEEVCDFDRFYVGKMSFLYDAKMVFYTILCILGIVVRRPPLFILGSIASTSASI